MRAYRPIQPTTIDSAPSIERGGARRALAAAWLAALLALACQDNPLAPTDDTSDGAALRPSGASASWSDLEGYPGPEAEEMPPVRLGPISTTIVAQSERSVEVQVSTTCEFCNYVETTTTVDLTDGGTPLPKLTFPDRGAPAGFNVRTKKEAFIVSLPATCGVRIVAGTGHHAMRAYQVPINTTISQWTRITISNAQGGSGDTHEMAACERREEEDETYACAGMIVDDGSTCGSTDDSETSDGNAGGYEYEQQCEVWRFRIRVSEDGGLTWRTTHEWEESLC